MFFKLVLTCSNHFLPSYKTIYILTLWLSKGRAERVVSRCSLQKVLLKILQNSQESTCAGAFLKACNFIKERLQCRCFPVNFGKFLKISTRNNICKRLLLKQRPEDVLLKSWSFKFCSIHRKEPVMESIFNKN